MATMTNALVAFLMVLLCITTTSAQVKKDKSYVFYENPNRPGTPMFINPFEGRTESDPDAQPKSWLDVYLRNQYVEAYQYYTYIPPNWGTCMNISPVSLDCQAFYHYIMLKWPWSKRLMPKVAYEAEEYFMYE